MHFKIFEIMNILKAFFNKQMHVIIKKLCYICTYTIHKSSYLGWISETT